MSIAFHVPVVIEDDPQPMTARAAYRAHLSSDCDPCAGGHYCSILDRLDYLAAREDSRG